MPNITSIAKGGAFVGRPLAQRGPTCQHDRGGPRHDDLAPRHRSAHLGGVTAPLPDIEWRVEPGLIAYPGALATMEARASAVRDGTASEMVWLVEHPPVYTGGTSATPSELIDPRFPVVSTGRGGRFTYHGPGQRVGYLMLDLGARGRDVRQFVSSLENWLIAALARFDIAAFSVPGRVGIWTIAQDGAEAKIGAIGVRIRRWVTLHGFSINLDPDLAHFGGIVPCGLADFAVTSAAALGKPVSFAAFDAALAQTFPVFLQTLSSSRENWG